MTIGNKLLATVQGEDGSMLNVVELPDGRYTLRRGREPVTGAFPPTPGGLDKCLDVMSRTARARPAVVQLGGERTPATAACKEPAD